MYRTILVPVDGSPLSERALPCAEIIARANGARIVLLEVVSETIPHDNGDTPGGADELRAAETYLADLAKNVSPSPDVEVVVTVGSHAEAILQMIHTQHADLVVMSTHGRSGLGRLVHGSVADEVMRQAPVPIVLIPAACESRWPTNRTPRILVPLDGSNVAEQALDHAAEMASALRAEIRLIQVVEPHPMADGAGASDVILDPTPELEAAHQYLKDVATKLQQAGQTVSTHEAYGFAVLTIVEAAADEADLIVMATHGRSGITRLLMGSVATGVVQQATIPILIVRPVHVVSRRKTPKPSGTGVEPA